MVNDPDRNTIEFSYKQQVFEYAAAHMTSLLGEGGTASTS